MKTQLGVACLALFVLMGCASTSTSTFFWGDYSETLYDYKKEPDEKTLKAHRDQLFLIITKSPTMNKKIPPGVCAEYGYYLIKEGKEQEGMQYLDQEMTMYPESVVFIQKLKSEYGRGKK
jgi:hypothetical protein